jgi:hypothetical protein
MLGGSVPLFVMLALAMVVFGLANAAAVASGVWFKERKVAELNSTVVPAQARTQ